MIQKKTQNAQNDNNIKPSWTLVNSIDGNKKFWLNKRNSKVHTFFLLLLYKCRFQKSNLLSLFLSIFLKHCWQSSRANRRDRSHNKQTNRNKKSYSKYDKKCEFQRFTYILIWINNSAIVRIRSHGVPQRSHS